jgi:hypothetical protein
VKEIRLGTFHRGARTVDRFGLVAKVDDEDYERISAHRWGVAKGNRNKTWYAIRGESVGYTDRYGRQKIGGGCFVKRIFMHREVMNCPVGMVVDHINHDTLDNRKENLRVVTQRQNLANRHPGKELSDTKSGLVGVRRVERNTLHPWSAWYGETYLGAFTHASEASDAHDNARRKALEGKRVTYVPPKIAGKTSAHRGVRLRPDGYWQAYFRKKHLGCFKTEAEAIERRLAEEKVQGSHDWNPGVTVGP